MVVAGCCFALHLAEGFVRKFYPYSRDHIIPGGLYDVDDYLGWKFKADKSATHCSQYFNVPYNINAMGFRDKPRNVRKGKNIYRILLYGDSQFFAWGVPADKRFSCLIENQRQDIEIWNLAVPGYGLDQQILSYKKYGRIFNADEVILFVSVYTLSRMQNNYIYKKYKPMFEMDQSGRLRLISIPKGKNAAIGLLYKSLGKMYLPCFLERRLRMLKEVLNRSHLQRRQKINTADNSSRELLTGFEKKIIIKARTIARENNQMITVITNILNAKKKDLHALCDQHGIGFLEIIFLMKKKSLYWVNMTRIGIPTRIKLSPKNFYPRNPGYFLETNNFSGH